jgi:hypothetical protein
MSGLVAVLSQVLRAKVKILRGELFILLRCLENEDGCGVGGAVQAALANS